MPNWITNTVTVRGKKKDLATFKEAVSSLSNKDILEVRDKLKFKQSEDESDFSFEKIVPIPAEIQAAPYDPIGYEWNLKNWGTKWPEVHCRIIAETKDSIIYEFDTAWTPPTSLLFALKTQYPSLKFTFLFIDEGDELLKELFFDEMGEAWEKEV